MKKITAKSNSLLFPEKLWVISRTITAGYVNNAYSYNIPIPENEILSYMAPEGDTAEARKRKMTGREWAGNRSWLTSDSFATEKVFDNVPMKGFKIVDAKERYVTNNIVWRIRDPRGFMIEIYSGVMNSLIASCTIVNGEIQEECVWCRDGGQNVLVNVGNELYQKAIENNTRIKKTSLKANPGDCVRLKNGTVCYYLGEYYPIFATHISSNSNRREGSGIYVSCGDKKLFLFSLAENLKNIFSYATNPIVEILEDKIDSNDLISKINRSLLNHTVDACRSRYVIHITEKKASDVNLKKTEIPRDYLELASDQNFGGYCTPFYFVFNEQNNVSKEPTVNPRYIYTLAEISNKRIIFDYYSRESRVLFKEPTTIINAEIEVDGKKYFVLKLEE